MEYEKSMQSQNTNVIQELSDGSFSELRRDGTRSRQVRSDLNVVLDTDAVISELGARKTLSPTLDVLGVNTHKVLDHILIRLTDLLTSDATVEQIDRNREIRFGVREYMSMTGTTDRKNARNQLIRAVVALRHLDLCTYEKGEGEMHMSVLDAYGIDSRGYVTAYVGLTFAKKLAEWGPMWLPTKLSHINAHDNPHSYYIARKLLVYRHINHKKPGIRDHISIVKLMEACPDLPVNPRRFRRDRIERFMRDLTALKDKYGILASYSIKTRSGDDIDPETIRKSNVDDVELWFELTDYPNMDSRYRLIE